MSNKNLYPQFQELIVKYEEAILNSSDNTTKQLLSTKLIALKRDTQMYLELKLIEQGFTDLLQL